MSEYRARSNPGSFDRDGGLRAKDRLFGRRINIGHLEVFVAVAKAGSMSAAAQMLGLTQPAVSQTIAKFEETSGLELFDRSARPPILTLRGETFLKHAIDVIESVRRLEGGLRFDDSAQMPVLRIGMVNSFAATLGPFIIKSLENTAAQWFVDTGYEASRIVALLDRRCDFVITADETPPPPGLIVLPLFSEPYRIVLPRHLPATPESVLETIDGMSMIRFGRDPHMLSRIDTWLAASGVQPNARYHLDTVEGAAQMVASGLGWSLLPPLAFFRLIERGEAITTVGFPGAPIRRTLAVVARAEEGSGVAERIWRAAMDRVRDVFLSSLERHAPDALAEVILPA